MKLRFSLEKPDQDSWVAVLSDGVQEATIKDYQNFQEAIVGFERAKRGKRK